MKINGVSYQLTHDDGGVLRFKENRIISDLLDFSSNDSLKYKTGKHFSLNEIWLEYYSGKYSKDEMISLYASIGYSLSGFCEVFTSDNEYLSLKTDEEKEQYLEEYGDFEPERTVHFEFEEGDPEAVKEYF